MRDPVDIDPWAVAFHAQQAAEKAIKAALVMEQVRIPRVHELERLVSLLPTDWALPDVAELARLSRYAVAGRCPSGGIDTEPGPGWDDADRALRLADRVVTAVRDGIDRRGLGITDHREASDGA